MADIEGADAQEDDFETIANEDSTGAISIRQRSPKKERVNYHIKRYLFGKAAMFAKRGYRVVKDVPEFYYVTDNAMVCPPLDGL